MPHRSPLCESSARRVRRPRDPGFTIAEMTVGLLVLSTFLTLVFQMYTKSNTTAAKGIWRVQSANEMRLGMRAIQAFVAGSAYPTQATATVLDELTSSDDYKLHVNASASSTKGTSGSSSFFEFVGGSADTTLVSVWDFRPVTDQVSNPPCTKYTLIMGGTPTAAAKAPGNRNLMLQTDQGTYSVTGAGTGSMSASIATTNSFSRILVRDVELVRVWIPTTDTNPPRGLFGVDLQSRDPIDGRLTHLESVRVEKNVAVKQD